MVDPTSLAAIFNFNVYSINWLNDESSDDEPEREGGEGWFDPAKPRGWNSIEVIPGIIKQGDYESSIYLRGRF